MGSVVWPQGEIVPTVARLVSVMTLAAFAGGCSLAFVKKAPPSVPEGVWVECTESKLAPAVDTIFGISFLTAALGISQTDGIDPDARNVVGPMYGLGGLALVYSAYVGFRETGRCDRLHAAAEARGIYGPYPPPYPYPPPQQPYPYPQPQPQPYPQPPAQPQPQPY